MMKALLGAPYMQHGLTWVVKVWNGSEENHRMDRVKESISLSKQQQPNHV
jgi:hypothetical protein